MFYDNERSPARAHFQDSEVVGNLINGTFISLVAATLKIGIQLWGGKAHFSMSQHRGKFSSSRFSSL